jgi:hypothetical protein
LIKRKNHSLNKILYNILSFIRQIKENIKGKYGTTTTSKCACSCGCTGSCTGGN